MPYSNEEILRDKNNNPIPQIWDSTLKKFVPYEGKVGLLGPNGQPVSETNPLEVRVRGLETELQELRQLMQSGDAKMQLTGRKVTEILISRAVRTETVQNVLSPPDWARGAVFVLRMHGATGSFGPEEGVRLLLVQKTTATTSGSQTIASVTFATSSHVVGHQVIWLHPGANVEEINPASGRQIKSVSVDLRGGIWTVGIVISGTFSDGQGIDAEVFVTWLD